MNDRHRWSERKHIPGTETKSGCDQTERTCIKCGLVRITMHPPDHGEPPWVEWRHPASAVQFPADHTPPCIAASVATEVAA